MMQKKIRIRTRDDEISKEMLSESQLEDPKVKEQVEKFGKYCTETEIEAKNVRVLDLFEELGYVKKTSEKVYKVYLNYAAHPYVPHVYPDGGLGIWVSSQTTHKQFDFYEDQYKLFFETAKEFKSEQLSGQHSHISELNIGLRFSYETEVYEVNDDFFDTIPIMKNSC